MRPFIHVSGAKQALALSKEAVRGIVVALGVAGSFKFLIDRGERLNISHYYQPKVAVDSR